MSIQKVSTHVARHVEIGVDQCKAVSLTARFCRVTAGLLSDQCYGVNVNPASPVVTVTPVIIPAGRSLTMSMNIADQNSMLSEEHTRKTMLPFVLALHALEKSGNANLDQPKGTKKLVLEFDPAGLLVLYKGIIGTRFPKYYGAQETLLDIESQIVGPSV